MGLYLVLSTSDLRPAVATACTSFYMPFDCVAVVSYEGSAAELARRLELDRTGGPGSLVGAPRIGTMSAKRAGSIAASLTVALLSFVLT